MRRTVLAAGAAALLASTATVALAQDQTPSNGIHSTRAMPERYGPNWGAPNSPFYGPKTQSSERSAAMSNTSATTGANASAMAGERRPERMTRRMAAEERRPQAGMSRRTAVEEGRAAAEERRPESRTARAHMRRPMSNATAASEASEERTSVGAGVTTAAATSAPAPAYVSGTTSSTVSGTTYGYGPNYGYGPSYGYGYGPSYGYGYAATPAYGPNWGAPGQPFYGPVTQSASVAPLPAVQPAPPVVAAAPVAPVAATEPVVAAAPVAETVVTPVVPVEGRAAFVGDDTYTYAPNPSDQYTNGNGGHWDNFENENPNGEFSAGQIRSGR
jgi:hypothetical protein